MGTCPCFGEPRRLEIMTKNTPVKPEDLVSGDMYWICNQGNDDAILAMFLKIQEDWDNLYCHFLHKDKKIVIACGRRCTIFKAANKESGYSNEFY